MDTYSEYGFERRGNQLFVTTYPGGANGIEQKPMSEDVNVSGGATVREYLDLWGQLDGVPEPLGDIAERYEACLALLEQARVSPPYEHDPAVSRAENAARKDEARARVRLQARSAYNALTRSLGEFGEAAWLDVLRPVVDDAISAVTSDRASAMRKGEQQWGIVLKICGHLRRAGWVPRVAGAEPNQYVYSSAPRLFYWRCKQSLSLRTVSNASDGLTYYSTVRPDAPQPTLAEALQLGFGPGLYTAAEVVAYTRQWTEARDAAMHDSAPEPASRVGKVPGAKPLASGGRRRE